MACAVLCLAGNLLYKVDYDFQSKSKQIFIIKLKSLLSNFCFRVKTEVQSLTNSEHLVLWNTTALTMQGLMTIAKAQETKTNLSCFLKKSIGILKVFLTHGIPILEITLRSKPDDVVTIFKTMQNSTRFLHHLCCYSKLTKDASLMAFVPKFRLTLETLVYRYVSLNLIIVQSKKSVRNLYLKIHNWDSVYMIFKITTRCSKKGIN